MQVLIKTENSVHSSTASTSAFTPWSIILELSPLRDDLLCGVRWLFWKRRIGERNKSHPRLLLDRFSPISFHAPLPPPSSSYTRTIDSYYFLRRRDTSFISGINGPRVNSFFFFFFLYSIVFCYSINRPSLKRQKAAFNLRERSLAIMLFNVRVIFN